MSRIKAALPGIIGPLLQDELGDDIDVIWWMDAAQAVEVAPEAEIGWFDPCALPEDTHRIAVIRIETHRPALHERQREETLAAVSIASG